MRPSPKPHHRMFRLHVRLPQSALTMVVPYWFELQSISEITAELWMDNFRSGLFLPFAFYCTEFPMNTSLRTPLGLCFVGSCIQGIQLPPDPMKDQFLSCGCVCVWVCVCVCLFVCFCRLRITYDSKATRCRRLKLWSPCQFECRE